MFPPSLPQVKWVNWMDGQPEYVVDPNMRFADIIVPTIDTVRAHFLMETLMSNFKPVSLVLAHADHSGMEVKALGGRYTNVSRKTVLTPIH